SEERKMGTIEMLLTLPVKDLEAVLGKYLAGLAFILTAFVFTFTVPVSVELAGDPEWGVMLAGYIGAVFLGGAYLAIGMFISSVTENQIVAFIIGVMVTFFLFIIGEDFVTAFAPSFFVPFLEYVGLGRHFNSITRGVVDSSDVIYYLSVIVFFVYLNIKSVESRRWK
ncbi:MAG: ABC transporter permease, partial [Fibrobacterota bacterium]